MYLVCRAEQKVRRLIPKRSKCDVFGKGELYREARY